MESKDFRNILLFMCNRWSQGECNLIFNEKGVNWNFSLGQHIWDKWNDTCESNYGSLNGITAFLLNLDNECLQKLIDRSLEYYKND